MPKPTLSLDLELTQSAKTVLFRASEEAGLRHQDEVTQRIILLGILLQHEGSIMMVFRRLDLKTERAREALERILPPRHKNLSTKEPRLSRGAINMLIRAQRYARELGDNRIGTEVILMALLDKNGSRAAHVLGDQNVSTEKIHRIMMQQSRAAV